MPDIALTSQELEEQLEKHLDPVLSSRRTAEDPAVSLTSLSRTQQDFVLHWTSIVAKTNSEMGYQFAAYAARAMSLMDPEDVEHWVVKAMDTYDKHGLYPGCADLQNVEQFARQAADQSIIVAFDDVSGVLRRFAQGLSGRELSVNAAGSTYTDTDTIYVPEQIGRFSQKHLNFALYKSIVVYLWAQTWFGTFAPIGNKTLLSQVLTEFDDLGRAQKLFHALETIRLNSCIGRELNKMSQQMYELQAELGEVEYPDSWLIIRNRLCTRTSSVEDTCEALRQTYGNVDECPSSFCFQGELLVAATEQRIVDRQTQEKLRFQRALAEAGAKLPAGGYQADPALDVRVQTTSSDTDSDIDFELTIDGQPIVLSPLARAIARSVHQDFGEIPADYLVPAGDGGAYLDDPKKEARDVWLGTYHEEGAFLYNEWDCRRRHYRKDWCVVRELDVHPRDSEFVERTLHTYSHLISSMRRSFEALRGEDKLLRKQKNGNDIDIDAVVEALADNCAGLEMSDRLFMKLNKHERDMAVVFMVDMSGSTKGWINEAEREALVLMCESLEILGDRYAIYGFSGMTRKRCELYRVKAFEDQYDEAVKQRIAGITPQDYTRMGATIRHLTRLLRAVDARTKLLITLSDGKPDDYDGYRGEYGIEDTRQALIEAKNEGVHPFCVTIHSEAREYLPRMYGAVNYVLVDEVRKLPLKVSDIYRKLTT